MDKWGDSIFITVQHAKNGLDEAMLKIITDFTPLIEKYAYRLGDDGKVISSYFS